ncbi:MAG: hypothetical protein B7Z78_14000 [Rhodospirillales bacterium 20-60-12]|nr:MAG: hypothetical protein B7Z78_14000 [Rhodospirillales bacterium 20-60-12]
MTFLSHFARSVHGATAIEYALIAALIAVAIIAALSALSGNISNTFSYVGNKLSSAT